MTKSRAIRFYLIFFAAGVPALVYQVAWQRVLTLYFGVDIYSTSIIVATFMLGLGAGSLLGGRVADRVRNPAHWYAGVEALLGLIGLISVPLFSAVGRSLAGGSVATVVIADFLLLLLPTTLMGMTLPLMCRIVIGSHESIGQHLSSLYGVNTFGAAVGALLTSYLLLGLLGVDGATYVAAALNLVLALLVYRYAAPAARDVPIASGEASGEALGDARFESRPRPQLVEVSRHPTPDETLGYRWVLVFSLLSGFIALGYEIVWYRILGLVLHGTGYVFGTILFFFLAGIAVGSLRARRFIDSGHRLERFALSQLGISAYAFVLFTAIGYFSWVPPMRHVISASFFTSFHPAPELVSGHRDVFALYSALDIAFWAVLIMGVPTFLMGYGFTNLMRAGASRVEQLGRAIGGLYFANIVGSVLGSLTVGFVSIHYWGSESTLQAIIALGAATAFAGLTVTRATPAPFAHRRLLAVASLAVLVGTVVAFPGRGTILRALHLADHAAVDFVGTEDRTGVAALRTQHAVIAFPQESSVIGQQRLYIDGSLHGTAADEVDADSGIELALAAHPAPRRVLAIGLGDGQMAATAVLREEVQELVVVELNGTLGDLLRQTVQGEAVLASNKTRYVVDDGRRWLQANPQERFDVIMMFPLHAAHASSGSLYSVEFLTLLASHLTDGGLIVVRTVDLYSTAKTIAAVFPYVVRLDTSVYIAGMDRLRFDGRRLPASWQHFAGRVKADRDVIVAHTRDARINTDLKPNSEFYITYPYTRVLQTRFADSAYTASPETDFSGLFIR